jgi:hypothetical protein
LKEDLPNQGFRLATLQSREARGWALRTDATTLQTGQWDQAASGSARPIAARFGRNAYAAFLDSPLGGAAVFPLTDGLAANLSLPGRGNLEMSLPAGAAPQKKGETRRVEFLIVGIPRRCSLTQHWPASQEIVERFYHDFALDGGQPAYALRLDQGTLLSQRYILAIDGKSSACFNGQLEGKLVSSLPIAVSNLNDRWSACLYDRTLKQSRPIGVFEGKAWATITLADRTDLFVGHPVLADQSELFVQLTQCGDDSWTLEIHNATDTPVTTRIRPNPAFDPLRAKAFPADPVTIPAGQSILRKIN